MRLSLLEELFHFLMNKTKIKRLYVFLFFLFILLLILITKDIIIKIILGALLLIYTAFIIFLRGSIRIDRKYDIDEIDGGQLPADSYISDSDEDFKIISPNKNLEIVKSNNTTPFYPLSNEKLIPPDLNIRYKEIVNEPLPSNLDSGGKFSFILEKILAVINDVFLPYSVIFFWYDKKTKKISVNKFITKSNDILQRKFNVEDDILSKIVLENEPQLLSDILPTAESDNIRYYEKPQGIKSFIGVPIFYNEDLIAIIAMDSKSGDAFGIETIYSLGRFIRVITLLIQIFEERYKEQLSQKRLDALLNFLNIDIQFDSYESILDSVSKTFSEMIQWDVFAITYFNPIEKQYQIIKVNNNTNLKYVGKGLNIDLLGTIVGKSITSNLSQKVDEISINNIYRYNKSEDIIGFGSFVSVPISFKGKVFGTYSFESLKNNHFTNSDIKFIESISKFTAYILHSVYTQQILGQLITIDLETLTLNEAEFKKRLEEELFKASSVNSDGVLALIKIDEFLEQRSLFDENPLQIVTKEIISIIKNEIYPYTILGRLSDRVFAAYFFNYEIKKIYVWSEKLRTKVARQPIYVDMKQNTYTISIGLCSTKGKTNLEEVFENAQLALDKAVAKGGNTVLYNS